MPRDRLLFKYLGNGDEFLNRIPARDLHESDRDLLTDEDMVTLAESPLYSARNDADEVVAVAEKRVAKAGSDNPMAADTLPVVSAPAPAADGAKK